MTVTSTDTIKINKKSASFTLTLPLPSFLKAMLMILTPSLPLPILPLDPFLQLSSKSKNPLDLLLQTIYFLSMVSLHPHQLLP